MSFSASLSLTVLHTGKRWFIICPVAETPLLDKEKTASHTSPAQGLLHTLTDTNTSTASFLFPQFSH